jgi:hypothetical protein
MEKKFIKEIQKANYNKFVSENKNEKIYFLERNQKKPLEDQKKEIERTESTIIVSDYLPTENIINWDKEFTEKLIKYGRHIFINTKLEKSIGFTFELPQIVIDLIKDKLNVDVKIIKDNEEIIHTLDKLFINCDETILNEELILNLNPDTKVFLFGKNINSLTYFLSLKQKFFHHQNDTPSLRGYLNLIIEEQFSFDTQSHAVGIKSLKFCDSYEFNDSSIKFKNKNLNEEIILSNMSRCADDLTSYNIYRILDIILNSSNKYILNILIDKYIKKYKKDQFFRELYIKFVYLKEICNDKNFASFDKLYLRKIIESLNSSKIPSDEVCDNMLNSFENISSHPLCIQNLTKFFFCDRYKISDFISIEIDSIDKNNLNYINKIYKESVIGVEQDIYRLTCLGILFREKYISLGSEKIISLHNWLKLILFLHYQDNELLRNDMRSLLLNSNHKEASIPRQVQYELFFNKYPNSTELPIHNQSASSTFSEFIQYYCDKPNEIRNAYFHFALLYQFFSLSGKTDLTKSLINFLNFQNADIKAFEYFIDLISKVRKF